ncbi:MAG: sulfite exporter TauE/SafE family protein [Clostridia bacterium]|nr:sulfite exporter TauE/SafE family protein [Clostridia bacterium]
MLREILFYIVVLVSNIIQGITGFAGTVLAMPVSVILVGFDTAKPVLNVLGILAGLYVIATSYKHIDKKEFLKITAVMLVGIVGGIFLRGLFTGNPSLLYKLLGVIVIAVGVVGIIKSFSKKKEEDKPQNPVLSYSLLITSGIVHGMFVCGGPLLVSYLTGRLRQKESFRATISAVWVVLNTVIMLDDIKAGYFNRQLLITLAVSAAVMFAAMAIGSVLYKKMSRELFMKITFVLLIISGASLFIK